MLLIIELDYCFFVFGINLHWLMIYVVYFFLDDRDAIEITEKI